MTPLREAAPLADAHVFMNEVYQVMARIMGDEATGEWVMLSIKRTDRAPIMDWRDMQWIKNQLLGSEIEAVQLFPAESRLVDTSNHYWLFASVDPTFQFPFGFTTRLVTQNLKLQLSGHGASQQRPFDAHVKPTDLEDMERTAAALVRSMMEETAARDARLAEDHIS